MHQLPDVSVRPATASAVIVDVREPKEYQDSRLPGAINLPSASFSVAQFTPYREQTICLVCETGSRARAVRAKLTEAGFPTVVLLHQQMADFPTTADGELRGGGWSVDRQFRLTLGLLLAVFLVGYSYGYEAFILLPTVLCTGLIFTALIDRCYLRMGIARLPWNRQRDRKQG